MVPSNSAISTSNQMILGSLNISFESLSGATKTVIDHFRERYSLDLKYKSLPCIDVGSEQKPIYLPIEVGNYGLLNFTMIYYASIFLTLP
jgi:hypothetical protein